MKVTKIKTETKNEWLNARLNDITSTDIAVLFNCSPYCSKLDLYLQKKNKDIKILTENSRMQWGNKLESVIAHTIAEENNLQIEEFNEYLRIEDLKIGSSFDYKIINKKKGDGILEIKNVDSLMFRKNWIDEDGDIQAPLHIEMQLQHQMLVSGLDWGYIGVLVGGNELKLIERERSKATCELIREKCKEFWLSIKENEQPKPKFPEDSDLIINMYNKVDNDKTIKADYNNRLNSYFINYRHAIETAKKATEEAKEAKAKILAVAGDASLILTDYGKVSCKMTKENKGKLITEDMVGTYIHARKSYRTFKFTAVDTE